MPALLVREAWDRIEDWCRASRPRLLKGLNPGASKRQVAALEAAVRQRLPEDLVASLLIHNGQSAHAGDKFLFGQLALSPCDQIAADHSRWKELGCEDAPAGYRYYPEGAIVRRYFHAGWVPVADEQAGANYLAVDLEPGPAGTAGQVIDFGRDIRYPGVVAPNWGEFLRSYADLLGILAGLGQDSVGCFDAFYRLCNMNSLDSLVLWARDGRWPIVRFDPGWRTPTVMSLARAIGETRDFSAMPILADALQEAGCDVVAILNHCRDPACRHARGCWVIDTLVSGGVTEERWCHEYGRDD